MLKPNEISFTYSDLQEMLDELQQTGANYHSQGNEVVWNLCKPFGRWSSRLVKLREDIDLTITEWDVEDCVKLNIDAKLQPIVGFSFCVSGNFRTKVLGRETDLVVNSGKTQIGSFRGEVKTISEVAVGQKVSLVQLNINPDLLKALTQSQLDRAAPLNQIFANTQTGFHWQTGEITPAMAIALHQILHCPYSGLTKQLYWESKVLELIALQLDCFTHHDPLLSSSLKPKDIERIYLAKDILIDNLDDPPSLLDLAKQSEINSFKLKQGFRQVFNTTAFGYLHQHRMEEARRLLELGDLNVTQVAQTVGYANPSKFSAAFKKKFGISPKAFKPG